MTEVGLPVMLIVGRRGYLTKDPAPNKSLFIANCYPSFVILEPLINWLGAAEMLGYPANRHQSTFPQIGQQQITLLTEADG